MESQGTTKRQNNFEKQQSWRAHTSWSQNLLQKLLVINTVWSHHKDKHIEYWNKTEINSHIYGQMIFQHGCPKIIQWGKDTLPQMLLGKLEIHMEKNEVRHLPYTIWKNELKMDWRHKWKSQSYKILGRKHREKASQHWIWLWFLGYDTKRRDKLEYIKIENFCASQDTNQQSKMVTQEWEKILANYVSDEGLISRRKELL